jgi:hypothetical protein
MAAEFAVPDPFPLRSIQVPAEVTAVAGCDCGGLTWHRQDCTIWQAAPEQAQASITDAQDRLSGWGNLLNQRLQQQIQSLGGQS